MRWDARLGDDDADAATERREVDRVERHVQAEPSAQNVANCNLSDPPSSLGQASGRSDNFSRRKHLSPDHPKPARLGLRSSHVMCEPDFKNSSMELAVI